MRKTIFLIILLPMFLQGCYQTSLAPMIGPAAGVSQGRIAYSASKAAMLQSTKVLAKELGRFKIRVNGIAPGLTNTKMMTENHSNEIIAAVENLTYLKKIASVDDIANISLFLASNLSSHISGQIIRVDGGI